MPLVCRSLITSSNAMISNALNCASYLSSAFAGGMYPHLGDAGITCRAMDGLKQAVVVKPVDPFEPFPFDRGHDFPGPKPVDDFGFVQAVYRVGHAFLDRLFATQICREGVIVRVTDAANRGLDPYLHWSPRHIRGRFSVIYSAVNVWLTLWEGMADLRIYHANTKLTCHSRTSSRLEQKTHRRSKAPAEAQACVGNPCPFCKAKPQNRFGLRFWRAHGHRSRSGWKVC